MNTDDTNKGATMGMWLFLFSEIMLFGGLFIIYANYYYEYTDGFITGAAELSTFFGTMNTAVLLVSSFTVAASVAAVHHGLRKRALALLSMSILLGIAFLVNKYFEWDHKFAADIYPGSDRLMKGPHGELIFFGLYFTLTGLHALHVIIGLVVLTFCLVKVGRAKDEALVVQGLFVHNSGLYWHLVDIIWIFLFPLLYLIL
ncbi:MAG: cytochrome c oxidase subunit 3 [Planctomycetota bacterium]